MNKPNLSKPIILASTSPTRQAQLQRLGLNFTAVAPNCDETPLIGESAPATAQRLAVAKAQSLSAEHPYSLVIGADQVALLNGQQLGKPMSVPAAQAMLTNMSGHTIEFYTAMCLLNTDTKIQQNYLDLTYVTIRTLTPEQIEHYLEKEPDAIYCAGAAKSEGLGAALIERIDSSDPNALLGLPIYKLVEFLHTQKQGIL